MLDGMQAAPAGTESAQVRGINVFRTTAGGIEGLGEVFNATQDAYTRVQVRMSLLDADGAVVAEKTVLTARDAIGPGEISPFRVHFPAPPVVVQSVRVEALPGDRIDNSRLTQIDISDLTTSRDNARLIIRGSEIKPLVYTVQSGDTLLGIAVKLGVGVDEITANNPDIRADTLQVGDAITVRAAVRLTVVAYDSARRVIGHRIVDLSKLVQSADSINGRVPFEIVVVTLTDDIADSATIVEVTR